MDNSIRSRTISPTLGEVDWDHLFDDLEGQLAAEWESERAALDAESERLRIAGLHLHDRLRSMRSARAQLRVEVGSDEQWNATLREVGADWIGLHAAGDPRLTLVPLSSISGIGVDHGTLLESLAEAEPDQSLRGRMTFGFVLRDLARRRLPVTVGRRGRDPERGTIDRAGADQLDLALHEVHEARTVRSVRGFRCIPFGAVTWVRIEDASTEL